MKKKYNLIFRKGNTARYYINGTGIEVQIGKYRGQDKFDKEMNHKYNWHNKWYVDVFNNKGVKLFNSEKAAKVYLKKIINKIYKTKQL